LTSLKKREDEVRGVGDSFDQESHRLVSRLERTHAREKQELTHMYDEHRDRFAQTCREGQSSLRHIREDFERSMRKHKDGDSDARNLAGDALGAARSLREGFQARLEK